jgi:Protein of unknown function (DUF3485)
MKQRIWFLPLVLVVGLSGVYFLPSMGQVAESAISMELPQVLESWSLQKIPPSEAELEILSTDTKFSKAQCLSNRQGEFNSEGTPIPDRLDLSIVLSGADINNSIHRPERCMPAQGHNITASSNQFLKSSNSQILPTKRLLSIQKLPKNEERTEYIKFDCVTYYFFVGHDRITNDHLGRTAIDMKDRLVRGMDQRWAYVSVSMWYGKVPWIEQEVTVEEADRKIQQFLINFSDRQINWSNITR